MTQALALLLVLFVFGCTSFVLAPAGKVPIANTYTINSKTPWSRLIQGKTELWTIDGLPLHELRFITNLSDGDKLLTGKAGKNIMPFQNTMTPIEVMEMVEGVFAASNIRNITTRNLRPYQFGSAEGFRFDFSFLSEDGLEKEGFAVGTIVGAKKEKRLHLIFYRGTRLYYYGKHKGAAENIVNSITLL